MVSVFTSILIKIHMKLLSDCLNLGKNGKKRQGRKEIDFSLFIFSYL